MVTAITGLAAGAGFGSFVYTSSKQTEQLSSTFQLGIVNLGNSPQQVTLSFASSDNVSVSFNQTSFRLPPSQITETPLGSGWMYLGDGRYAKPTKIPVELIVNKSADKRVHTGVVTVESRAVSTSNTAGTKQDVVQIQQHELKIRSLSARLDVDSTPEPKQDVDDPLWTAPTDNETSDDTGGEEEDQTADNKTETTGSTSNQDAEQDAARQPERNITQQDASTSGDDGVDTVTIVLATGILLSGLYILREIL
jgi:hypothetical protein